MELKWKDQSSNILITIQNNGRSSNLNSEPETSYYFLAKQIENFQVFFSHLYYKIVLLVHSISVFRLAVIFKYEYKLVLKSCMTVRSEVYLRLYHIVFLFILTKTPLIRNTKCYKISLRYPWTRQSPYFSIYMSILLILEKEFFK
jgi:hypothetical protein